MDIHKPKDVELQKDKDTLTMQMENSKKKSIYGDTFSNQPMK